MLAKDQEQYKVQPKSWSVGWCKESNNGHDSDNDNNNDCDDDDEMMMMRWWCGTDDMPMMSIMIYWWCWVDDYDDIDTIIIVMVIMIMMCRWWINLHNDYLLKLLFLSYYTSYIYHVNIYVNHSHHIIIFFKIIIIIMTIIIMSIYDFHHHHHSNSIILFISVLSFCFNFSSFHYYDRKMLSSSWKNVIRVTYMLYVLFWSMVQMLKHIIKYESIEWWW